MYRKKNAVEKAKDLEACTTALEAEHKALGHFFSEVEDWGADGYVRCSWMLTVVRDAYSPVCMAFNRVKETHVGEGNDLTGKWSHTTHINCYEDD